MAKLVESQMLTAGMYEFSGNTPELLVYQANPV